MKAILTVDGWEKKMDIPASTYREGRIFVKVHPPISTHLVPDDGMVPPLTDSPMYEFVWKEDIDGVAYFEPR